MSYNQCLRENFVHSFLYMIIEPVHLLPEVKCQCNSYVIVYLKSIIRNYSIAGKKRPLYCFRRYLITLPYLVATNHTQRPSSGDLTFYE